MHVFEGFNFTHFYKIDIVKTVLKVKKNAYITYDIFTIKT